MATVKDHMAKFSAAVMLPSDKTEIKPVLKSQSAGMTAPGSLLHYGQELKNANIEVARLKASQGLPALILISLLRSSPYQTRKIDESKVSELISNLSSNPLSTPITVRLKEDGFYEIIAGHHRVEAYKHLGRESIQASVVNLTDAEAEKLVFYDNLLAPQLSDFEKFQGFAQLKKNHQLTQDQLATDAGISRSLIANLMSFERLPPLALEKLSLNVHAVGSNLAVKLAALPENLSDRIVLAIDKIIDERLTQKAAIPWIEEKEKPQKPIPKQIKSGRYKYADLIRKDTHVSIRFASAEDAQAIEDALFDLLAARAKGVTNANKG